MTTEIMRTFLPLVHLTFRQHGKTAKSIASKLGRNKNRSNVCVTFSGSQKESHISAGVALGADCQVTPYGGQMRLSPLNICTMSPALSCFPSRQFSLPTTKRNSFWTSCLLYLWLLSSLLSSFFSICCGCPLSHCATIFLSFALYSLHHAPPFFPSLSNAN